MQICSWPQTDNHASALLLCFLQAGCPPCCQTNSVKALEAKNSILTAYVTYEDKKCIESAYLSQWYVKVTGSIESSGTRFGCK